MKRTQAEYVTNLPAQRPLKIFGSGAAEITRAINKLMFRLRHFELLKTNFIEAEIPLGS
jgi:hypothetical protein